MKITVRSCLIAACATLLAACNSSGNDPGPGGVTQSEAEALDAAAAKLDAQAKLPEAQTRPETQ